MKGDAEMKKCFLFLILMVQGCGMSSDNEVEKFNTKVSGLIGSSESIKIVASELTDFEWDNLCFQRENLLQLTFSRGGAEIVKLKLRYEDYFTDEDYVKGSLDGRCVSSRDHILLKRKYPGYSKTIEFMSIEK